jgi:hypothetical protein
VLASSHARAGDDEELQSAVTRLEAAKYDEAIVRFQRLLDPKAEPCPEGPDLTDEGCRLRNAELIVRARGHYALALFAKGRLPEVREQIETILRASPTYQPNPSLFPQELMDIVVEVRGRLAEEIAEAARIKALDAQRTKDAADARRKAELDYIANLEKQAAEELTYVERSRLYAFVPFGVGQLQNGDTGLALFFGLSQLFAGGASIGTAIARNQLWSDAQAEPNVDQQEVETQIATMQAANAISFGVFAASAVIGVVEAQLSFDEAGMKTRTRPLPKTKPKSLSATVVPTEGGAFFGASGSF